MPAYFTHTRKAFNEDAGFAKTGAVCVLDGVTRLGRGPEAGEQTSVFTHSLAAHLSETVTTPLTLKQDLAEGIARAIQECGSHGVTSTLSLACWDSETLAVASLGDSIVYADYAHHREILTDPTYIGHEVEVFNHYKDLRHTGMSHDEAYAAITPTLIRGCEERNGNGSPEWLVSDHHDPELIAENTHFDTLSAEGLVRVSAVTDGALTPVDTFAMNSVNELIGSAEKGFFPALMARSYRVEDSDTARVEYPRLSFKDDATIAVSPA